MLMCVFECLNVYECVNDMSEFVFFSYIGDFNFVCCSEEYFKLGFWGL